MNPINVYHLLMVHISWQRFSIVQNQWRKVWLWHEPSENYYFQSKAKQQEIKFVPQVYAYLEVALLFQPNKILKTHDLVDHC